MFCALETILYYILCIILYTVPCIRLSMLPAAFTPLVTKCLIGSRLGTVAFLLLLILSATETSAHATTVEHDLHIVHNVDNRSKFFSILFCHCNLLDLSREWQIQSAMSVEQLPDIHAFKNSPDTLYRYSYKGIRNALLSLSLYKLHYHNYKLVKIKSCQINRNYLTLTVFFAPLYIILLTYIMLINQPA